MKVAVNSFIFEGTENEFKNVKRVFSNMAKQNQPTQPVIEATSIPQLESQVQDKMTAKEVQEAAIKTIKSNPTGKAMLEDEKISVTPVGFKSKKPKKKAKPEPEPEIEEELEEGCWDVSE